MREQSERTVPLVVSESWLAEHLQDEDLRLIDTRYYFDGFSPQEEYERAHIPGAVYADVERDLTGHLGNGGGRHPLPSAAELEPTARRLGISMTSHVVAVSNSFAAARLWWMLRYFGFERVSLLDGGLSGWTGPLESGPSPAVEPGDFVVGAEHSERLAFFEEVVDLPAGSLLLDARGPDRYRGEAAPGDPYAGHIPGARSAHWQAVGTQPDDRFAAQGEIRARLSDLGAEEANDVICYCGSGVQACHLIFSTQLAGLEEPRLYVGSWSEYSRRLPQPAG